MPPPPTDKGEGARNTSSSDGAPAGALWDSKSSSSLPGSLRRISARVPQVDRRVWDFCAQASPPPHCAALAVQLGAGWGSAPGPALGPHYLRFRVRPAENLAGPPRGVREHFVPSARRPSPPPCRRRRSAGRSRSLQGLGRWGPQVPVPGAQPRAPKRSYALVLCIPEPRPRSPLLAHELGLGHTARNLEVQKDAVAHFKTKPNY